MAVAVFGAGCSDGAGPDDPGGAEAIAAHDGNAQVGTVGVALPAPLRVKLTDEAGNPVAGVTVTWSVTAGGGSITATSPTDAAGIAAATFTLGATAGTQTAQAAVAGLDGSPVTFTAEANAIPEPRFELTVVGGGSNVPDRFTSDLWVHGNHAYTGTWGVRGANVGNVLNVWNLGPTGAPTFATAVTIPGVGTVSDVEVSADGQLLLATTESGPSDGLYLYSLANPGLPVLLDSELNPTGLHTGTFATIAGKRYVFAAANASATPQPTSPALAIYDVSDPASIGVVGHVSVPPNYGIHDTFVRDGIAFVFAWDTGVILYDVGNGIKGGSPASPKEISRLATAAGTVSSPKVHNGWWFHNPANGEKRYLFIGQEGPGSVGLGSSSGDIHVVDISNLNAPVEVATFHMPGAGVHNFWMDEAEGILYAAYYNGGVVALDVTGTLSGDLTSRLISSIKPGGATNTFTWGVQLHNGYLYASDMLSGLWQLGFNRF
jgi:hypothetical protein